MSAPLIQSILPAGLEVRVIRSVRYASQLARVKVAAFKQHALNAQMYPLESDEHGTTAWLEERETWDLDNDNISTVAIIDTMNDEILARAKWKVPRKFSHPPNNPVYDSRPFSKISYTQECCKTLEQNLIPPYPDGFNISLQNSFRSILQQKRKVYYDAETDYCELNFL